LPKLIRERNIIPD